jgi:hypothetical protein
MADEPREGLRGEALMDAIDANLQAASPQDFLDTSAEDAEIAASAKLADELFKWRGEAKHESDI